MKRSVARFYVLEFLQACTLLRSLGKWGSTVVPAVSNSPQQMQSRQVTNSTDKLAFNMKAPPSQTLPLEEGTQRVHMLNFTIIFQNFPLILLILVKQSWLLHKMTSRYLPLEQSCLYLLEVSWITLEQGFLRSTFLWRQRYILWQTNCTFFFHILLEFLRY